MVLFSLVEQLLHEDLFSKIEPYTNKEEANRLLKILIDKIYYCRGIEANAFSEEEETIKLTIAPK